MNHLLKQKKKKDDDDSDLFLQVYSFWLRIICVVVAMYVKFVKFELLFVASFVLSIFLTLLLRYLWRLYADLCEILRVVAA